MAEEADTQNGVPAGAETNTEPDPLTTSDGAVRQLEKADRVAANQPPDPAGKGQEEEGGEVIALGKERGGAPEDTPAGTG